MGSTTAARLVEIAKAIEPADGYFDHFSLIDALNANPEVLARFQGEFASATWAELDALNKGDNELAYLVMGAADALDLLPDDPRLFLSEADANALPQEKVLGALCSACIVNDQATVARLASRVDVNTFDHNKQTALCYAVGNNHPACVRILLEYGANPNLKQNWGHTVLHVGASSVCSQATFALLVQAGGDLSIKDDKGKTVVDVLRDLGREHWVES